MADNDTNKVVDTAPADVYKESDDFVPDPGAIYGTLETSGTQGGTNESADAISPVFDAAKAQDLQYAARAVDPEDTDVPEGSAVTVSTGATIVQGDPDADRDRVRRAAEAFKKDPVKIQDPSVTDAEKAKEDGTSTDPAKVEALQKQGSPAGDNKGGTRTTAQPTK